MFSRIDKLKRIADIIALPFQVILFCCHLIYLVWYLYSHWYGYMNADIAGDLLLAKTLADEDKLFLTRNWWTSTELHLLHTQTLQSILFRFTSSFRLVFVISFIIFVIMITITSCLIVYQLTHNKNLMFIPVLISLAPVGEYWAFLYQVQAYITYVFWCYLFLYLILQLEKNEIADNCSKQLLSIFISLLSFALGASGIRFFIQVIIPIIVTFILAKKRKPIEYIRIIVPALAGFLVYEVIIKHFYSCGNPGKIIWATKDAIKENLYTLPVGILDAFGALNFAGQELASVGGMLELVSVCSIIGVYVICISQYFRIPDETAKMTFNIGWIAVGVTLFPLIFTSMGQVWGRPLETHYLAMSLCFIPIMFAVAISESNKKLLCYGLLILLVFRVILADVLVKNEAISDRPQYIEFLMDSGYSFGYSDDYWSASLVNALSNDVVGVVQVNESDDGIKVRRFNNRSEYDKLSPEFILISKESGIDIQKVQYELEQVYEDDKRYIFEVK
ncbi:hypothetical protein [Butyrivibrio sp. MB2005]|uniref:hypothetical protein n=1 Tax=Butyrivibrio sp. MB2005 TaxID=1280678 RepID=UPI0003FEE284|nr:hypothetical protein [Butyrivibrio sp. MB2005]